MINKLKSLFTAEPQHNYNEIADRGATILDVRTTGEYRGGHVNGSINIPLQNLKNELSRLNKQQPVIVCCASGARSRTAQRMLESYGFAEVYNGGGWMQLQGQLN